MDMVLVDDAAGTYANPQLHCKNRRYTVMKEVPAKFIAEDGTEFTSEDHENPKAACEDYEVLYLQAKEFASARFGNGGRGARRSSRP